MDDAKAARRERMLRDAYAAFNARDVDAVVAVMSPDVEWPKGTEGGYIRGHDEVRAYWSRVWAAVRPTFELGAFVHEGDEVVIEVRQVVCDCVSGRAVIDTRLRHAYRFDGDLICRMEIRPVA